MNVIILYMYTAFVLRSVCQKMYNTSKQAMTTFILPQHNKKKCSILPFNKGELSYIQWMPINFK